MFRRVNHRANLPDLFAEHESNLDCETADGTTLADAFIAGAVFRDAVDPLITLRGLGLYSKYRHSRNY